MGEIFENTKGGLREDNPMKKAKKDEYTRTHIPVGTGYGMIPGTAVCSKESTAQHGTAPQVKARHRTAPHGAALLSYSWAELNCDRIFLSFNL